MVVVVISGVDLDDRGMRGKRSSVLRVSSMDSTLLPQLTVFNSGSM